MLKKVLIVCAIILVLIGLCGVIGLIVFNFYAPIRTSGVSGVVQDIQGVALYSAEATDEKSFPVNGPASVDVDTSFGNIIVAGGPGSQVAVTAHKTVFGSSQAAADSNLQALKVTMTQVGNQLTLRVDDPQASSAIHLNQNSRVDFTIQVPTETTAVAHTRSGNVSLSGTQGKADLTSDFGDVQVSDVKGGVAAHSSSGQITASRIQLLPSGNGDVSLNSEFGEVNLQDVSVEHVRAHSGSGSVNATNVASSNEIDLTSSYGGIILQGGNAATLNASTNSGDVGLQQVKVQGALTAHSDFGGLRLTQVDAGSYDLSSKSGAITSDIARGTVKASTDFGNIEISGGSQASLTLMTSSGQIHYAGSLGTGPHSLKSDFGAITLTFPGTTSLDVDLKTDFGQVKTGFQVTTTGTDNKHLVGSINGGGAKLTAETKNGDINVDIANP